MSRTSTVCEGSKAQSDVITPEEINVTVQQKNSEFRKEYLPKKANLQVKHKFQRSWLDQIC
jgi:hypothetical protein